MHEHITRALYYFDIHLLYASIVGFAAWALTFHGPRKVGRPKFVENCAHGQNEIERGRVAARLRSIGSGWPLGIIGRLREYHLSRPDRYHAFSGVVALRNPDAYTAVFADTG